MSYLAAHESCQTASESITSIQRRQPTIAMAPRLGGVEFGERLPLMVMPHQCHQNANSFAASTRMNVVAARERFLVLHPEQDRLSNPQG
jgi:poly(3-hydroxybutyrate) depolymerase